MNARLSSSVTIQDGEITVATHLLAQQLRLSVAALKPETPWATSTLRMWP